MNYFLDTEFIEHAGGIDLVSIGIVNEKGDMFSAESTDFNPELADDWVRENVFKKLELNPFDFEKRKKYYGLKEVTGAYETFFGSNQMIAQQILEFIGDDKEPVFYAYYAAYDWVVFARLFGRLIDKPEHFPMYVMDIKQMMHERGLTKEWKREHCPDPQGDHNALVDAMWNRDLFNAIMKWEEHQLALKQETLSAKIRQMFNGFLATEGSDLQFQSLLNEILEAISHYGNLTYPPRRVLTNQNNTMQTFVLQVSEKTPMTRAEYNNLRGWDTPLNEDPSVEGYHLKYPNGTQTWVEKKSFEELYQEADERKQYRNGKMTFGEATELAKLGFGVGRKGWNGANMFAYIVPESKYKPITPIAKAYFNDQEVPYRAYWALKTAQGDVAMWAPSGSDSLAEDWEVIFSLSVDSSVHDKIQIIY